MTTAGTAPLEQRPRRRRRWVLVGPAHLVALYLTGRAAVEPFSVALEHGAYHADWGGPTLLGVLAVHMLPGVIAAWAVVRYWRRTT